MSRTAGGYGNTLDVTIAGMHLLKKPTGSKARAWERLVVEHPELDGARISDTGQLDVELERTMGTASDRLGIVRRIAAQHGAEVQTYTDTNWTTTWTLFEVAGETVILHAKDCTCHPDRTIGAV
jgi:hypothetical protein